MILIILKVVNIFDNIYIFFTKNKLKLAKFIFINLVIIFDILLVQEYNDELKIVHFGNSERRTR